MAGRNVDDFISSKKRDVNTSPGHLLKGRVIQGFPQGQMLSSAIEMPTDPRFDSAREAVALIDRVHGVRGLNLELDVDPLNANTDAAYAAAIVGIEKTGVIFYNASKNVSKVAFLEELGHALDHQAFTNLGGYATDTRESDLGCVDF